MQAWKCDRSKQDSAMWPLDLPLGLRQNGKIFFSSTYSGVKCQRNEGTGSFSAMSDLPNNAFGESHKG